MFLAHEETQEQVDRILRSDTFRASAVLRKLFRFLADKALAGSADDLNEYAIGVDALGKPASYDPRQDAIVRLHIGRLRQKLGDYYRNEGKDDPVFIDLPKGRFKLIWECRSAPAAVAESLPLEVAAAVAPVRNWRRIALAMAAVCFASVCWGAFSTVELWRASHSATAPLNGPWTPELESLWTPFLESKHPLLVALADPLFFGFQGTDLYVRKISLRHPEEAEKSPEISTLRRLYGGPVVQPLFNFTPTGEVRSSFLLAKLLGSRRQDISLVRGSKVALQGMAENNIVLVGPEAAFGQAFSGVQMEPEFAQVAGGIRNLHPKTGEPEMFADAQPSKGTDSGEVYALVTKVSGPLGNTEIESFTSSRTWGRQGAIQAFTDADLARSIVNCIRTKSGLIPRYYQIVLRVRFWDGLATKVTYVTHRAISNP